MVKHEHNESACLPQENWIRRLFLIMQYFLADIASADDFNLVFASIVAKQSDCKVGKHDEQVVRRTFR